MAAISASFSFTPSVSGGLINATGDSLTEIKVKVKAALAAKLPAAQAQVDAITAADAALDL